MEEDRFYRGEGFQREQSLARRAAGPVGALALFGLAVSATIPDLMRAIQEVPPVVDFLRAPDVPPESKADIGRLSYAFQIRCQQLLSSHCVDDSLREIVWERNTVYEGAGYRAYDEWRCGAFYDQGVAHCGPSPLMGTRVRSKK